MSDDMEWLMGLVTCVMVMSIMFVPSMFAIYLAIECFGRGFYLNGACLAFAGIVVLALLASILTRHNKKGGE